MKLESIELQSPFEVENSGYSVAVLKITQRSTYAIRVKGKPSWAGVALLPYLATPN